MPTCERRVRRNDARSTKRARPNGFVFEPLDVHLQLALEFLPEVDRVLFASLVSKAWRRVAWAPSAWRRLSLDEFPFGRRHRRLFAFLTRVAPTRLESMDWGGYRLTAKTLLRFAPHAARTRTMVLTHASPRASSLWHRLDEHVGPAFPALETLVLGRLMRVDDATLRALSRHAPSLTTLTTFGRCAAESPEALRLPSLRGLTLHRAHHLVVPLAHATNLHTLRLHECRTLNDHACMRHVVRLVRLRTLLLTHAVVGDDGLRAVLAACPLEDVTLMHLPRITGRGYAWRDVRTVSIKWCPAFDAGRQTDAWSCATVLDCESVRSLRIGARMRSLYVGFGAQIEFVAPDARRLAWVAFDNVTLPTAAWIALMTAMEALRCVYLTHLPGFDDEAFAMGVGTRPRLQELGLTRMHHLTILAFYHCPRRWDLVEAHVTHCKNLEVASFAFLNHGQGMQTLSLVQIMHPSYPLGGLLGGFHTLTSLAIIRCPCLDDALWAHAWFMPLLRTLTLSFCSGITDRLFAHGETRFEALTTIHLTYMHGLGGGAVPWILATCPAVDRVDLTGCGRVDDDGVVLGARGHPRVVFDLAQTQCSRRIVQLYGRRRLDVVH